MGKIAHVCEPARDWVQLSQVDNHLARHLALYKTEELERFQELQLLPAAKSMITHRLAVGLCEGDGVCPARASSAGGGGVYFFNRIRQKRKKLWSTLSQFLDGVMTLGGGWRMLVS